MPDRLIRDPARKELLHPRNRHRDPYDFPGLARLTPALARFVHANRHGVRSIDFADPGAVRALNQALLRHFYGITHWDLPAGYLCPPIPGRADYLHYAADLLAGGGPGGVPRGPSVRVLDIGVGASCVYPIVGSHDYGWRFVGSDIDPVALQSARRIADLNASLVGLVDLRLQRDPASIFTSIVGDGEHYDLTVCNPPFHSSAAEASRGSQRKRSNLTGRPSVDPVLNFGGGPAELWCPGGELAFIGRMIAESARIPTRCRWFTTLVSREAHLPRILGALKAVGAVGVRTLSMAQGQKRSRIVAWTFVRPSP